MARFLKALWLPYVVCCSACVPAVILAKYLTGDWWVFMWGMAAGMIAFLWTICRLDKLDCA